MCFGGSPQAPEVVYRGPSDADIQRNRDSLNQYQSTMQKQQADFQAQLQSQIDKANQDTADLQKRYENEAAAAAAASAAQQTSTYAISASQSETPQTAQTTAAVVKKKKPDSNLKISMAATPSAAGTGLNIGV